VTGDRVGADETISKSVGTLVVSSTKKEEGDQLEVGTEVVGKLEGMLD